MPNHDAVVQAPDVDPDVTVSMRVITDLVPQVIDGHHAQTVAIAKRRAAEAELLTQVLEIVRPAIPALANKLLTATASNTPSWYPLKGVVISASPDEAGPTIIYTSVEQRVGVYTGLDTVLLEDGALCVFKYTGVLAMGPKTLSTWSAEVTQVTPAVLFERYPFKVERMLVVIGQLLERDRTGRHGSIHKNRERVTKLKAILALLEG